MLTNKDIILSPQEKKEFEMNWSENINYHCDDVLMPETVYDVQNIVKSKMYKHLRVVGTRHTFNE